MWIESRGKSGLEKVVSTHGRVAGLPTEDSEQIPVRVAVRLAENEEIVSVVASTTTLVHFSIVIGALYSNCSI